MKKARWFSSAKGTTECENCQPAGAFERNAIMTWKQWYRNFRFDKPRIAYFKYIPVETQPKTVTEKGQAQDSELSK
jgi:hypothetical protein